MRHRTQIFCKTCYLWCKNYFFIQLLDCPNKSCYCLLEHISFLGWNRFVCYSWEVSCSLLHFTRCILVNSGFWIRRIPFPLSSSITHMLQPCYCGLLGSCHTCASVAAKGAPKWGKPHVSAGFFLTSNPRLNILRRVWLCVLLVLVLLVHRSQVVTLDLCGVLICSVIKGMKLEQ